MAGGPSGIRGRRVRGARRESLGLSLLSPTPAFDGAGPFGPVGDLSVQASEKATPRRRKAVFVNGSSTTSLFAPLPQSTTEPRETVA